MRILLFLFLALALTAQERMVILLRHAEKLGRLSNAELTTAGRRRALALSLELEGYKPALLFATERPRSQQTLEPLARRLGVTLEIRPYGAEETLAEEILQDRRAGTVVICAHSDSIGPLAHFLGYPGWIPEVKDYDRLWILRLGPKGFIGIEERHQKPLPPPEKIP